MSKTNTIETKLKQRQYEKLLKNYIWTDSEPVDPLISFLGASKF